MAHWQQLVEEIVATRRGALVGYAYVLSGDLAEAEDLVHDAILRTFRSPRSLKDVEHAEAYVRRAIANQFLNRRRSHGRFRAKMHLIARPQSTSDETEAHGTASAVRDALRSLSPRERACVVLRYYEHQSVAEIAATLGIAEGSVKRYLSDGVKKLGTHLDSDFAPASRQAVVTHSRRPS